MSFKKWFDEADIPLKDENGKWYDAETGFPYIDDEGSLKDSKDYYFIKKGAKACKLGGIALTGSPKQKSWAEDIRASFIDVLEKNNSQGIKELILMKKSAKWFIDNRDIEENKLILLAKNSIKSYKNKIDKLIFSSEYKNDYDLVIWFDKKDENASRQRASVIRKMEEEYSKEAIQKFISQFTTGEDFMLARGHNKPYAQFIKEYYK